MVQSCQIEVDKSGRELVTHGTTAFPVGFYENGTDAVNIPWHWHEEWEIGIITQGCCWVAAGSGKALLEAGQGFFINSGILHGCWEEGRGCEYHSLVFHPRLIGGSFESIFYANYVKPLTESSGADAVLLKKDIPWQKAVLEAAEGAWQACAGEKMGYEFEARAFLSRCILEIYENLPKQKGIPSEKQRRDEQRIKTMLSFIHEHYGEEMNTAQIAGRANISESECLRCFRSTIRSTPIRYLKQYRIQQAARMLVETEGKISDIAERCGFQDMSYFTKSFREEKQMTPTQFRERRGI